MTSTVESNVGIYKLCSVSFNCCELKTDNGVMPEYQCFAVRGIENKVSDMVL